MIGSRRKTESVDTQGGSGRRKGQRQEILLTFLRRKKTKVVGFGGLGGSLLPCQCGGGHCISGGSVDG